MKLNELVDTSKSVENEVKFNFSLSDMKQALESSRVNMPAGLSREERRKFLRELDK
jgi:hypothetical protein